MLSETEKIAFITQIGMDINRVKDLDLLGVEVDPFRESVFFVETVSALSVKIGIQLDPPAAVFRCNCRDAVKE